MIQRRTSTSDLRKGLVSISDKGMAMIEAANPETARVTSEIERLFGSERLSRLVRLLEELEGALGPGQPAADSGALSAARTSRAGPKHRPLFPNRHPMLTRRSS